MLSPDFSREFESGPDNSMDYYLSNSNQYEDISDQENENDFKEPEAKHPVVQKDPFDENSDREERKAAEKSERKSDQEGRKKVDR